MTRRFLGWVGEGRGRALLAGLRRAPGPACSRAGAQDGARLLRSVRIPADAVFGAAVKDGARASSRECVDLCPLRQSLPWFWRAGGRSWWRTRVGVVCHPSPWVLEVLPRTPSGQHAASGRCPGRVPAGRLLVGDARGGAGWQVFPWTVRPGFYLTIRLWPEVRGSTEAKPLPLTPRLAHAVDLTDLCGVDLGHRAAVCLRGSVHCPVPPSHPLWKEVTRVSTTGERGSASSGLVCLSYLGFFSVGTCAPRLLTDSVIGVGQRGFQDFCAVVCAPAGLH